MVNSVWKSRTGYVKSLCLLAFPVMLEQLGQIMLGTVDTFFAGRIGDSAIAAINVTNMFMNLFATAFTSLGIGVMVMVSHALGEKNEDLANRFLRQAILLGIAVGAGFGALNLIFQRPFLLMAGAREEILSMGLVYYQVVCVPCVFMCLTLILANGLKAAQNTRASMGAAVTANVVNALLDWLFIRMGLGVFGLGLATTLARALHLLILIATYRRGVTVLRLGRWGWKLEAGLMKKLLGYSGPVMLTYLSARFAILIHGSLILHLGSSFYVANSITTQIDEFACIPSAGFEAAVATMVSSSLGAKKREDASRYTLWAFLSNAVCMTVIGLVLAVFALPLAGLFTQTAEIQAMIRQVLVFMVFFNWTSALSHVLTSAVQGTGDAQFPLYVTLAGNLIMRLGVGYALAYSLGLGLIGIWMGIVLDFLFRGSLLGARFYRKFSGARCAQSRL